MTKTELKGGLLWLNFSNPDITKSVLIKCDYCNFSDKWKQGLSRVFKNTPTRWIGSDEYFIPTDRYQENHYFCECGNTKIFTEKL